ncbi:hypothetical protein Gotur_007081, partial [Gossypium turneri]
MVKQMQEKFNKYWAEYYLILSYAAILDPCYKLNYVYMLRTPNPRLPFWLGVPMFRIMILFILVCNNSNLIGLIWEEIMMRDGYKRYLNASSIQSEKSLLDIYLDEPELELNSQIDVLDYWS